MKITKVGKRYAQSLLQLAVETGVLEAVKQDVELLSSTCAQSKDLVNALNSPVIKSDKKLNVLKLNSVVILMSSDDLKEVKDFCATYNVHHFLQKPISRNLLLNLLDRI